MPDDLKTAITTTGYAKEVLADNTYADNMWGLPIFTGGTGIYYNTDMYTAAGITEPAEVDGRRSSRTRRSSW